MSKQNSSSNHENKQGEIVLTQSNKIQKSNSIASRALSLIEERKKTSALVKIPDAKSRSIVTKQLSSATLVQQQQVSYITLANEKFRKLESFLAESRWYEADHETKHLVMEACNRTRKDWMRTIDVQKVPLSTYERIDELWNKYSSGKFGFNAQRNIFKGFWRGGKRISYHSEWCKFGEAVGWRNQGWWDKAIEECDGWFSVVLNAQDIARIQTKTYRPHDRLDKFPVGHFPRICRWRVGGLVIWAGAPRFPWGALFCELMLHLQDSKSHDI